MLAGDVFNGAVELSVTTAVSRSFDTVSTSVSVTANSSDSHNVTLNSSHFMHPADCSGEVLDHVMEVRNDENANAEAGYSSSDRHKGGRPKGSKDSYKRTRHIKMPRDKKLTQDSIALKAEYQRDRVRILSKEKKLKESIDKANSIIAEQKMLGITQQSTNRQMKAIGDADKALVSRLRRVEKRLLMKETSLSRQSYPTKFSATLFRGMVQAIYVDLENLANQTSAPVEIVEQSLAGLFTTFREQFKTIAQELLLTKENASHSKDASAHGAIDHSQDALTGLPKSTNKAVKKTAWVTKKTSELEGAAAMTMAGFSSQHLLRQLQQENEDDDGDSYM